MYPSRSILNQFFINIIQDFSFIQANSQLKGDNGYREPLSTAIDKYPEIKKYMDQRSIMERAPGL